MTGGAPSVQDSGGFAQASAFPECLLSFEFGGWRPGPRKKEKYPL